MADVADNDTARPGHFARIGPKHRGRADRRAGYLGRTLVTDAGPKELATLTCLDTLNLGGTQVTDAGLTELRTALPGCKSTP
jgi:hypothetical protein